MTTHDPDGELEVALFFGGRSVARELARGAELFVGRDASCDLAVDDPSVSRRHAALRRDGARVRVEDLGSANGTFLREAEGRDGATMRLRPVRGEAHVSVGAVLQLGVAVCAIRRRRSDTGSAAANVASVDPAMRAVRERLARAAASPISILLLGETGVGKEVLARHVHGASSRAARPFLGINCAALAPTLAESELFGHEKGAFTGAVSAKVGLLESANGGTVFLDEIGELPLDLQAKLLRVLEERTVLPVGGRAARRIDVRIVSATHRDLDADCRAGRFRQDLLFRLDGMSQRIPPLRERVAEILPLARHFLRVAAEGVERPLPALSPGVATLLERHAWPGNVRELRNAMELAAVLCTGDEILIDHLPDRLRDARPPSTADGDEERARVLDALARCDGNQTRAAELLGVSRRTLVTRLTSYGMTRPRARG